MSEEKIRITFSCSKQLRELLTKRSDEEGIPRSQLIVELLETELSAPTEGKSRDAAVSRLIFDIQKRVGDLETWKREIRSYVANQDINTTNLEQTVAHLLNDNSNVSADIGTNLTKKQKIPSPKQ